MKKAWAIIGCIVTVVIALVGFSGYSAGTHYMTWMGIKLSQGGFIALICAFVLMDIISLKNAFGADKRAQQEQIEAQERAREAQPLEGGSCTVYLTRTSSVAGAAMGVRVFLNGEEQEVLKNGQTIVMQTAVARNELTLRYNAGDLVRKLEFDAEPGGTVHAVLQYNRAVLSLREGDPQAVGEPDANGRYRPVRGGYILWSIINMPIYLLGLVPLFKTLSAAKQPFDDIAQQQLRSAKIWNIVLSCFLVLLILVVVLAVSSHS